MQLPNNVWNKDKGYAQAQVAYPFGRSDQRDLDVHRRLTKIIGRLPDHGDSAKIEYQDDDLRLVRSRPAGGAHLLKALWNRLRIDGCLKKALKQRSFSLFATREKKRNSKIKAESYADALSNWIP